jgi:hypothetical protein
MPNEDKKEFEFIEQLGLQINVFKVLIQVLVQ